MGIPSAAAWPVLFWIFGSLTECLLSSGIGECLCAASLTTWANKHLLRAGRVGTMENGSGDQGMHGKLCLNYGFPKLSK